MKSLLLIILSCLISAITTQAQEITFQSEVYDYGDIELGSDGMSTFTFINTGEQPLIIMDAKSTCGCLVVTYPKDPIMSGQTVEIKGRYDTKRRGPFTKYIIVTTNAKNNSVVRLKISGRVLDKKEEMDTQDGTINFFER